MNAARNLLEIFTRWSAEGFHSKSFSTQDPKGAVNYLQEAHQAVSSLKELSLIFDIAEQHDVDVSAYREGLANWCRYFIEQHQVGRPFTERPFLTVTADVVDSWMGVTPIAKKTVEAQKESLTDQLTELIQHLLDDESLDLTLKNHAVAMSKELLRDIENVEKQGFYDFGESVERLKIYVSAAAERSNDDSFKAYFRKFNDEFLKHPQVSHLISLGVGYFGGQQGIGQ